MKTKDIANTIKQMRDRKLQQIADTHKGLAVLGEQQHIYTQALATIPNTVKWVSTHFGSISYTMPVKGFKTAACKRQLEKTLDCLEQFGRVECSSNDYPDNGYRSFEFKLFMPENNSSWNADLTIIVRCELIEGGSACRRVQVGETVEVVKTPQYQFICK